MTPDNWFREGVKALEVTKEAFKWRCKQRLVNATARQPACRMLPDIEITLGIYPDPRLDFLLAGEQGRPGLDVVDRRQNQKCIRGALPKRGGRIQSFCRYPVKTRDIEIRQDPFGIEK